MKDPDEFGIIILGGFLSQVFRGSTNGIRYFLVDVYIPFVLGPRNVVFGTVIVSWQTHESYKYATATTRSCECFCKGLKDVVIVCESRTQQSNLFRVGMTV